MAVWVAVQSAKDTFYAMLRDRVAAANAARTVVVRGLVRPGVVVAENELPGAAVDGIALVEAYMLRWTGLHVSEEGGLPLVAMVCEIRYGSDGAAGGAGMDRGRGLGTMDAELLTALLARPRAVDAVVVKEGAAGSGSAAMTPVGTRIWWGTPAFQATVMRGERMERTAAVEVFCYGK